MLNVMPIARRGASEQDGGIVIWLKIIFFCKLSSQGALEEEKNLQNIMRMMLPII